MSDPKLTPFLEKNNFVQGDKPLKFVRETEYGPFELWLQPLKRTKYAGEIRYSEFVGCRVIFTLRLEVPSRFTVVDTGALNNPVARFINKYINKNKKQEVLDNLGNNLSARVASREWSESILRDDEAKELLAQLFHPDVKIRRQQSLVLDPRNLTYPYRIASVNLDTLDALIPPFLSMAEKIKKAEEPKEKLSLTSTETYVLNHPYRVAFLILAGLMLLLLVPFILIGIILFLSK